MKLFLILLMVRAYINACSFYFDLQYSFIDIMVGVAALFLYFNNQD